MNKKEIYFDQRAGRTVVSRCLFVLIYLLFPIVCAWGIYLLWHALVVDLPLEVIDFGYDKRSLFIAIALVLGIIACTYCLGALSYILFYELPRQISQILVQGDQVILTPIIGNTRSLCVNEILGLFLNRKPHYWYAPFSYSMVGWKFQRVLKTASGMDWLLVEDIVKMQKTDELLQECSSLNR